MIFVTVGTHEQPFNRLVEEIDRLKGKKAFDEEVIIQRGYSTYVPKYCMSYDLIGYEKMEELMRQARIIITHGGPASFIAPLSYKKIPVVVPRQKQYKEHINDHQLEFTRVVAEKYKNIILVEDVNKLENVIKNYSEVAAKLCSGIYSNTSIFNQKLKLEVQALF